MRVIDLVIVYFAVGAGCAIALDRITRGQRASLVDRLLVVIVWPLYVPALLAPREQAAVGTAEGDAMRRAIECERTALGAAIDAVASTPMRSCLPTRAQLDALGQRIDALDGKVRELDAVLASDAFDAARAARAVEQATREGGAILESTQMVQKSIERLQTMRAHARRERDELLALCRRLRTQLVVLRYAERDGRDELGGVVAEILVRVEAVGASLEAAIE